MCMYNTYVYTDLYEQKNSEKKPLEQSSQSKRYDR
jgi:hypothetical protein